MPLTFTSPTYTASVTLADYTGLTVPVKYNLIASNMAQAIIDAQVIANKLKALSAHQVVKMVIRATFADVDGDTPTGDIEETAYFGGETVAPPRWAVVQVPGYSGPVDAFNNIDLLNTIVNDYLSNFDSVAYVYDNREISEFCRGWVLTRNTEPK